MNKKLVLIIVSSVLAVALLVTGVIFLVKNTVGCTVSLNSQKALAGNTVEIPISLSKNVGLYYGQLVINYDSENLSLASCVGGNVFEEFEYSDVDGTVNILINQLGLTNTKEDGTIATLVFYVKESADKGEYEITFDKESAFCNVSDPEDLITPIFKNGKITVK